MEKSKDSNQIIEALRQFVYDGLQNKKNGVPGTKYHTILSQIDIFDADPLNEEYNYDPKLDKQLGRWLNAISKCSTLIDSSNGSHNELTSIIFRFNWIASLTTVEAMCELLLNLVITSSNFMMNVTKVLVSAFLLPHAHPNQPYEVMTGLTKDQQPLTLDGVQMQVHLTIKKILEVVPSFISCLTKKVAICFPHQLREVEQHQLYIKNLLWITEYAPTIQDHVLTMITERLIELDVNSCQVSSEHMTDQSILKLDTVLCILLEYLKLVNDHGPPLADHVFHSLLRVFERTVLRTHKSRFTQLLIFYHCSFKHAYAESFLRFLLHKMFLDECPIVDRIACASYIAGFLSHAAFLPAVSIVTNFQYIVKWLHEYIDRQESSEIIGISNAAHHKIFYSMCEALFTIFVCKKKLFTLVWQRDDQELKKLNFRKIVESQFNPFRFCGRKIVVEFAKMCQCLNLGKFDTILRHNEKLDRRNVPSSSSSSSNLSSSSSSSCSSSSKAQFWELLTKPFLPYSLPLSSEYVDKSIALYDLSEEDNQEEIIRNSPLISYPDLAISSNNDNQNNNDTDVEDLLKSFTEFASPSCLPTDSAGKIISPISMTAISKHNLSPLTVDGSIGAKADDGVSPMFSPMVGAMNISPQLEIRSLLPNVPVFELNSSISSVSRMSM